MAATTLHVILFLASIVHLFFVCGVVRCHGVSELRDDGDDDSLGNDGYGRRRDGDRDEYKIHQQVLHKMKAKEEVLFEGGSFKIWWRDVLQFPDVNIEVSEITFEEGGLLLPQYADSDGISYVLEGSAKVGIVSPSTGGRPPYLHIKQVERGDVVGIPKGVVFWWYNDGEGVHRIFSASDSTTGIRPGRYHQFSLAGAKGDRFGGMLHGFSRKVLAAAWGVDEKTMSLLLDSQKDTTMIKASRKISLTDPRIRTRSAGLHIANVLGEDGLPGNLGEFKYKLDQEYPDLYVKRGGWIKAVNQDHLPILKLVGMSAVKVGLEKNAVEGPVMLGDAHQVIYVMSGSGKIEISNNDGETILSDKVQEGSVVAIPKFYPSVRVAGDEGLTLISFLTSPRPLPSYLVGKNSFFDNIPMQVLAASFDVDEQTLSSIWEGRRHDEAIFPPPVA